MHAVLIEPIKAAFVLVPKCATTSIKHAILRLIDGKPFVGRTRTRINKIEVTELSRAEYPDWLRLGTVRNSWSRLLSCWRDKIERRSTIFRPFQHYGWKAGMSFEAFVRAVTSMPNHERDGHFAEQIGLMCDAKGEFCVDWIMRFERLTDEWARFMALYPRMKPLKTNGWTGPSVDYHEFYTAETWALVGNAFSLEIRQLGYGDDSL